MKVELVRKGAYPFSVKSLEGSRGHFGHIPKEQIARTAGRHWLKFKDGEEKVRVTCAGVLKEGMWEDMGFLSRWSVLPNQSHTSNQHEPTEELFATIQ